MEPLAPLDGTNQPTSSGIGRSKAGPGASGRLGTARNRRSALPRRRVALEDEASASLVIGGIGPEEVDLHAVQFLGAIACERLDVFVVKTALVLLSEHRAEFGILREARRSLPQFSLERPGRPRRRRRREIPSRAPPSRQSAGRTWVSSIARACPTRRGKV